MRSRLDPTGMITGEGGQPDAGPVSGVPDEGKPPTPIQLAGSPERAMAIATRRIRQGAAWLHGALAVAVMALVAWLPRTQIILSIALAVIGTVQVSLADAHRWVGGLHPLGALVVLTMAARIAWDSPVGSLRRSAGAATGAGTL